MLEYPHPNELKMGFWVEIEQGHAKKPIHGEISVVLGEADPESVIVKLNNSAGKYP